MNLDYDPDDEPMVNIAKGLHRIAIELDGLHWALAHKEGMSIAESIIVGLEKVATSIPEIAVEDGDIGVQIRGGISVDVESVSDTVEVDVLEIGKTVYVADVDK